MTGDAPPFRPEDSASSPASSEKAGRPLPSTWTAFGDLPCLTADLPGIGGTLKSQPEDFIVEEIPAYEPSGEGEHLFLWIEKRDIAADDLILHIASALGISRDDVGTAGLKDRRAITRQYVSVPAICKEKLTSIETDAIHVLRSAHHGNKLRTGHLRGNRFELMIRNIDRSTGFQPVRDVAEIIREHGFPNYYGDQRFGTGGDTLTLGIDLLAGRKKPRDVPHRQRRFLLRLALSSVQSALFNEVLASRLRDGLLHTVLVGDVMQKRETGGMFVVEDDRQECLSHQQESLSHEQQRFDVGETVITGPMFGPKMRRPLGLSAEREATVLQRFGLSGDQFAEWKRLLPGTRRPLLAFASGLTIEQTDSDLRLTFSLDRGVYATTLLREFQKSDSSGL